MNKLINGNKKILVAAILIAGISAGILGYWQYKKEIIPSPAPTFPPAVSISPTTSPDSTPTPTPMITPPPEVWETYTNSQLGFSIKYPQTVYGLYRCSPNKPFYAPVKVFEDNKNGITYITQEYYYQAPYSEELKDYTEPCEKITYSLESLKKEKENYGNPLLAWVINIINIKNDAELNKFIKDNYGSSCIIDEKKLSNQKGVYDITIKGTDWTKNGDPEPVMTCGANYAYKILYFPENNKVMSVNRGQDCTFQSSPFSQPYVCGDDIMIDNFNFK